MRWAFVAACVVLVAACSGGDKKATPIPSQTGSEVSREQIEAWAAQLARETMKSIPDYCVNADTYRGPKYSAVEKHPEIPASSQAVVEARMVDKIVELCQEP